MSSAKRISPSTGNCYLLTVRIHTVASEVWSDEWYLKQPLKMIKCSRKVSGTKKQQMDDRENKQGKNVLNISSF